MISPSGVTRPSGTIFTRRSTSSVLHSMQCRRKLEATMITTLGSRSQRYFHCPSSLHQSDQGHQVRSLPTDRSHQYCTLCNVATKVKAMPLSIISPSDVSTPPGMNFIRRSTSSLLHAFYAMHQEARSNNDHHEDVTGLSKSPLLPLSIISPSAVSRPPVTIFPHRSTSSLLHALQCNTKVEGTTITTRTSLGFRSPRYFHSPSFLYHLFHLTAFLTIHSVVSAF